MTRRAILPHRDTLLTGLGIFAGQAIAFLLIGIVVISPAVVVSLLWGAL